MTRLRNRSKQQSEQLLPYPAETTRRHFSSGRNQLQTSFTFLQLRHGVISIASDAYSGTSNIWTDGRRKEGNVLFNDALNTFYLRLYGVRHMVKDHSGRKEMFYLTMHSTHFIYGYMASHIWLRTILIVRKETRFRHIGYSFRLTARVLLYAPSHRQDSTYHGLCYTSRGALAGTRNSSMGPPSELKITTETNSSV